MKGLLTGYKTRKPAKEKEEHDIGKTSTLDIQGSHWFPWSSEEHNQGTVILSYTLITLELWDPNNRNSS